MSVTGSWDADGWNVLEIVQASESLEVTVRLEMPAAVAAVRSRVTVVNLGSERIVLRSVPSWNSGFTAAETDGDVLDGWARVTGRSDWLGEGRWERQSLRGPDFPSLAEDLTGHDPRGSLALTSDGTWSTGRALPTAALVNESAGWQSPGRSSTTARGAGRSARTPRAPTLALRADRRRPRVDSAAGSRGELRDGAGDGGVRGRLGWRRRRADRLSTCRASRRMPTTRRCRSSSTTT